MLVLFLTTALAAAPLQAAFWSSWSASSCWSTIKNTDYLNLFKSIHLFKGEHATRDKVVVGAAVAGVALWLLRKPLHRQYYKRFVYSPEMIKNIAEKYGFTTKIQNGYLFIQNKKNKNTLCKGFAQYEDVELGNLNVDSYSGINAKSWIDQQYANLKKENRPKKNSAQHNEWKAQKIQEWKKQKIQLAAVRMAKTYKTLHTPGQNGKTDDKLIVNNFTQLLLKINSDQSFASSISEFKILEDPLRNPEFSRFVIYNSIAPTKKKKGGENGEEEDKTTGDESIAQSKVHAQTIYDFCSQSLSGKTSAIQGNFRDKFNVQRNGNGAEIITPKPLTKKYFLEDQDTEKSYRYFNAEHLGEHRPSKDYTCTLKGKLLT